MTTLAEKFPRDFTGELGFLSNYYCSPIEIGGYRYETVEHYYQSQKCSDLADAKAIRESKTASEAKHKGQKVTKRPDWDEVKLSVMETGVLAKFEQNPDLAEKLLATGDMILEEGNTWDDTFWGVDYYTRHGANNLGKILMKVRNQIRQT